MLANNFCKPKSPIILPNAKAKFAKLIVKIVKNKSLNDFIYLFISKKIIKLVNRRFLKSLMEIDGFLKGINGPSVLVGPSIGVLRSGRVGSRPAVKGGLFKKTLSLKWLFPYSHINFT